MANPVTTDDVEDRWRTLTDAELVGAQALLDDAWSIVLAQVPHLEERIASGAVASGLVVSVVTAMVLRVLRNPEGLRQESIDDYSYTRDQALSGGLLYLTDAELSMLSVRRSGAFTIHPGYVT